MNAELDQVLAELGMKTNATLVILTMALLLCRIIPVLILSPIMGGETTPPDIKIGVGVTLGIVMYPAVADRVTLVPVTALAFIAVLFKEIFIGFTLSFIVSSIFEAARIAGTIVDTQAGAAQAQIHVPALAQQVTIMSSFKLMLAVTLFLTLNGHHIVIAAIADSLKVIPLDTFPRFGHGLWALFDLVIKVFGEMFAVGLALAAPAMIAAFLSDLALGMINRVAPQLQVFFISMAVKPLAATLMIFVAIHLIMERLNVEFEHTLKLMGDAVKLLQ